MKDLPVLRRPSALGAALALGLSLLVACGDDSSDSPSDSTSASASGIGLEAVAVQAESGQAPEVEWTGDFGPDEVESEVLVEGDGETLEEGDAFLVNLWIGNGTKQERVYDTYETAPGVLTLGESLMPSVRESVAGQSEGAVVAIASPAESAYGEQGDPRLGMDPGDAVLFVVEVLQVVPDGPAGADRVPAGWAPALSQEDGVITGLDFAGTPEPTDRLRVTTLIEGEGPEVEDGQTVVTDYLGQVYGGDEPFDTSFGQDRVLDFQVGAGRVIEGWDRAVAGRTVGSRLLVAIPPDLGYGEAGQPGAGISGTDTLYFVVDVLAAG